MLWHIDALLERHENALDEFFKITTPSDTDVDELFEYLLPLMDSTDETKKYLEKHLPALIKLRPKAAAGLVADHLADSCLSVLRATSSVEVVELGQTLLEAGRLTGDAAAAHFRNLCRLRPKDVRAFMVENVGLLRPEEALAIVREEGPPEAEPVCLEAVGDPGAALDAILRLAAAVDEREASVLLSEGAELCARAAPALPPGDAAELWTRLLSRARAPPPGLLLEAAAYLPVAQMLEGACESPRAALALLRCAALRHVAWSGAARGVAREAHEKLARALAAARRGLAVRGRCVRCGRRLAERPVRSGHCARATHLECEPEASCGACGRRVPSSSVTLASKAPRRRESSPPRDFELYLVAPPRPDLEGSV